MDDCIFCRIVDGEIPSYTVYEDHDTLAFLDANPLARGHTLVIPKAHHQHLQDLPVELAGALGETLARVAGAVETAVDAPASTVAYNNGEAAGQEVPHVHAHVVPRFEDDGVGPIHGLFGGPGEASEAELEAVAADVGGALPD
jgi:histidine triad (HIT) family protein